MKTLILLRGVSGSGKTTLAQTIIGGVSNDYTFCDMFAADDYFQDGLDYKFDVAKLSEAHKACQDNTRTCMLTFVETERELDDMDFSHVVLVHNTFTRKFEMEPYFNMAKEYGYQVHTVIVENRHGGESVHNVPDDAITRQASRFDVKLTNVKAVSPHLDLSFSELIEAQKKVPQRPDWHPEGNNYNHTMIVLGRVAADIPTMSPTEGVILSAAALFHDVGKIDVTNFNNQKLVITSYGHAEASLPYWEKHAPVILGFHYNLVVEQVSWLIKNHMDAKFIDNMSAEKQAIMKTHDSWTMLSRFANTYDNMVELSEEERDRYFELGEKLYKALVRQLEEVDEEVDEDELV